MALGTAWVTSHNPTLRILPIILGIFGYTYGSLLGVFMVGLFTKGRGSDFGNRRSCGFDRSSCGLYSDHFNAAWRGAYLRRSAVGYCFNYDTTCSGGQYFGCSWRSYARVYRYVCSGEFCDRRA